MNANDDHSEKFSNQADHDNCSEILREVEGDPIVFSNIKEGMRLDLTDEKLLAHLRKSQGELRVQSSDIDKEWDNFKGNFNNE